MEKIFWNNRQNCNKIYNLPKKLSKNDYDNAVSFIIKKFSKNKYVRSIYLAGGEWITGVSDLDIYIVIDDDFVGPLKFDDSVEKIDNFDFIVLHRHDFFTESSFKYIYYILSEQATFRLVYGKAQNIVNPKTELSEVDYNFLNSSILVDFLVNKMLLLDSITLDKDIDVRKILCEFYSIKYSVILLEKIVGIEFDKKNIESWSKLRKEWFLLAQRDSINKLFDLAPKICEDVFKIVKEIDNHIRSMEILSHGDYAKITKKKFINNKFYIRFVESKNWTSQLFKENFRSGYVASLPLIRSSVKRYFLVLPSSFACIFYFYALNDNIFGQRFKNFIVKGITVKNIFSSIVLKTSLITDLLFMSAKDGNRLRVPNIYGFVQGRNRLKHQTINCILSLIYFFRLFCRSIKRMKL